MLHGLLCGQRRCKRMRSITIHGRCHSWCRRESSTTPSRTLCLSHFALAENRTRRSATSRPPIRLQPLLRLSNWLATKKTDPMVTHSHARLPFTTIAAGGSDSAGHRLTLLRPDLGRLMTPLLRARRLEHLRLEPKFLLCLFLSLSVFASTLTTTHVARHHCAVVPLPCLLLILTNFDLELRSLA